MGYPQFGQKTKGNFRLTGQKVHLRGAVLDDSSQFLVGRTEELAPNVAASVREYVLRDTDEILKARSAKDAGLPIDVYGEIFEPGGSSDGS